MAKDVAHRHPAEAWPINWAAICVGAMTAGAAGIMLGLAGISVQALVPRAASGIGDSGQVRFFATVAGVLGAFLSSVVGGWAAGKMSGTPQPRPVVFTGVIAWFVTVPLVLLLAGLVARFEACYAGLGGAPMWVTMTALDTDPKVAAVVTALLIGLVGSAIGGWMALGAPMMMQFMLANRMDVSSPINLEPIIKEQAMNRLMRIVGIASVTCMIAGPALAQSQTGPSQNPSESRPGSQSDRPVPPAPPATSPGRSNQDVQAPRENQDVQSPRERDYSPGQRANQDVQSPRDTQDRQTERGQRMSGYHTIRSGQEALKSKGFDPGEIDGRYGPNTQAAISKYQRENGLRETGRFDKATLNQLGVNSERVDTTGSSSRRNRSN